MRAKKKIKVVCLVNTLTLVNQFIYANHIGFFNWHAKYHPEIEFIFFTPHRMAIDTARNVTADYAIRLEADYVLFLDDDVMVPKDALWRLIQNDKDVCAGLVIIRGMPFNVMAFKYGKSTKERRNMGFFNHLPLEKKCAKGHKEFEVDCFACEKIKLKQIVDCDAVGFSLCLIKTSVLKKVAEPYFVTGTRNTEDVYFCIKAKDEIKNLTICMDTSIECGHLLNPEPIQWTNRKDLINYYNRLERFFKQPKLKGRDKDYFSRNLQNLK